MLRQIATEPIEFAPAESESAWRRLSAWAMPWLLSSSVHLIMLVVLALTWHFSTDITGGSGDWAGLSSGISLKAVMTGPRGDASGGAVGVEISPSGDEYFSDETAGNSPALATPASVAAANAGVASDETGTPGTSATGQSVGGALGAVLGDKPLVSLTGLLPEAGGGAGSALGKGALEGGRVGNANRMTKGPNGNNRPGGGSYARTGIFGVVGEGHKFAYVFDRSGSMDGHGGAPLAAAKSELIASLDDLGQTHQFQIIFYNEHPRIFNLSGSPGKLVWGNDQNKMLARKFVGGITADGGTQHEEALLLALRMAPDVIFFLTDADEPQMSAAQLQKIAKANKGSSINAVEFGFGPQQSSDNFLVRLARQNGGQHVYVDVSQLPRAR